MIGYYLRLAFRSLRRTPMMTALMVCAIGLGIGASMAMLTVLHVMTRDPLPARSGVLFTPRIDALPNGYPRNDEWGDPADNMTWPDAMELLRAAWAPHQAAMAGGDVLVWPADARGQPSEFSGRFTTADFFPIFGVALERGTAWSAEDDAARARVVVLGHDLARRLFGGANPIGRSVRFADTNLRVIGVSAPWRPQPLFYASSSAKGGFGQQDEFFLPLSTSVELHWQTSGRTYGWGPDTHDEAHMYTDASTSWLQFWVQLDTPAQVARYRRMLHAYADEQHRIGRFERPAEATRLYPLMDWLRHLRLVPYDIQLQLALSLGFLGICLLNIVALLLAKFLRRGSELGVRRALGAQQGDLLLQLGIEAMVIGLLGGGLGALLAQAGLWCIRQRPDRYAQAAHMDLTMLVATISVAVLAALLAGVVPAWRASRVVPSLQVKAL